MLLYVMDNYNSCFLKSIGQGCFEVGPGYSIMTNLHLLFDIHLIRCLYLFPSIRGRSLVSGAVLLQQSLGAVVQNTDDLPKCWPWLFPLTEPDASSREATKASRIKSKLCHAIFAQYRYFELENLFFPSLVSYSNNLILSS